MAVVVKANDLAVFACKADKITLNSSMPHLIVASTQTVVDPILPPVTFARRSIFDFLGLPRELRDMIYEEALPETFSHMDDTPIISYPLGLLYVNKQVSAELIHSMRNMSYRLRYKNCSTKCPCRTTDAPDELLDELLDSPDADGRVVVHHDADCRLTSKQSSAIRNFRSIEVWYLVPRRARHTGQRQIAKVVQSMAGDLLSACKKAPSDPLKLRILWSYPACESVKNHSAEYHLKNTRLWISQFKRAERHLDLKIVNRSFREEDSLCWLAMRCEVRMR